MMDRYETYLDAFYAYFTTESPILKILGQFENLGFVIMSTREKIRLIARTPLSPDNTCRQKVKGLAINNKVEATFK